VRARMRFPVIASSLALACLLGAWASGSEFTQKGQTGFSMAMAMLTGVALLCTAVNIRMLSAPSSK
jgi:Kef-type K+ transport system membrane component KefB